MVEFETKAGNFRLAQGSPAFHEAVVIPNFAKAVNGAPNMRAQETIGAPMIFGVKMEFNPPADHAGTVASGNHEKGYKYIF
jgi:hypothetical protein